MHDGRLYRVFRTLEDAYNTVCCGTPDTGSVIEEERTITFPEESGNGRYIVVRHTRTKHPPEDESKRSVRPRPRVSCTAFRWTPQRFTFLADKDASTRLCAGK